LENRKKKKIARKKFLLENRKKKSIDKLLTYWEIGKRRTFI
jgi:hypothetical protein